MTTLDPADIEFGLDTFGDIPRKEDGTLFTHAEAIRATLHEAVLADEIGVDTSPSANTTARTTPSLPHRRCWLASPPQRSA